MKQLKSSLFVLLLALLAWNCQKEEQQIPPNEGLHFLESKFSLEDFNDPFIKDNLKVNWDRYSKKFDSLSNTTIYAFETSVKGKLKNEKKQFEYKYQVLGHKQGGAWTFGIVHILANNASSVEKVSYFEPESFSGTMHHYDLKGKNTKAMAFEQGELVGEITDMDNKSPTGESKEPPASNEGVWVFITVERYIDMYMYRGGGVYEYSYSVHNGTQHQWAFISTGGTHSTYGHEQGEVYHGHHAGPSAPANPEDIHDMEYIFEEHIHDNNLKPCMKTILADLKTIPNGVGQIVGKFAGNTPGFNWEVKDGNTGTANAQTSAAYNNGVTTTLSNTNLNNATDLSIARTILHEAVHAYFVTVQNLNLTVAERSQLMGDNWFALVPKLVPNQGHALFASNFVNDISGALYEYAKKKNINVSLQYCKDLAWGGLTHYDPNGNQNYQLAPWFVQNVPSSSDRQRILNNIDKEQNGKVGKKGNDAGC